MPVLIDKNNTAFNINNENNFVSLTTKYAENHLLVGKGAGSQPTGAAVYSDILELVNHHKSYDIPKSDELKFTNDASIEVFISTTNPDSLQKVILDDEYQVFEASNYHYKVGRLSIEKLLSLSSSDLFVGMISEKVTFNVVEKALVTA